MFMDLKVCDKCRDLKSLILCIDLPSPLLDNVIEYFQCVECDETHKRQFKNEKRRNYYRLNKERMFEKTYCYRVRKNAQVDQPMDKIIVNEMNRRLLF